MKQVFFKYLPDILFILGIAIVSYYFIKPQETGLKIKSIYQSDYTEMKVLGIILITLALDIALRRKYFK